MATLTDEDLLKTVECFLKHECQVRPAAEEIGVGRNTFRNRLRHARKQGLLPEQKTEQFDVADKCRLEAQIIELKKELKSARRHQMSTSEIKRFIHEIRGSEVEQPNWVIDSGGGGQIGTPCLLVSDAHWYERVDAEQIGGANEYSAETARARLRTLCERTVDLLTNHIARPGYPGIVCAFAGDMLSGNIHEELKVTNEGTLLQAILDLYGHAIEFIRHLADEFGRVFVPCVAGNHSRLTPRIQAKNFAYENVDWHLYCLLEKHFEKDDRIRFLVSDSEDVQFRIHGWVYRMTHGSQFRGGDGIIGPLGPICVAPETPVLKADLTYVPAGDLNVGDELIGFDDQPGPGLRRRFKPSFVTEFRWLDLECVEIETEDGLKTIASLDHPWLTRSGDAHSWIQTKRLHIGSRILTLGEPWSKEETWEAGYLSGVLDGEGFVSRSRMGFTQQNNACLEKALSILDARGIPYKIRENGAERRGFEPCHNVRLFEGEVERKAAAEMLYILGSVRPERLIAEKSRILWDGRSVQIAKEVRVIGLRYVGIRRAAGFTTSTSTFIANGMLTHNTRGDIKKRAQATNLGAGYDTLLLGHFHRLMQLRSVIVNGSIKGFDEYAKRENFPWDPPQQALWITHPERGITLQMPVHLDRNKSGQQSSDWVSWQDRGEANG